MGRRLNPTRRWKSEDSIRLSVGRYKATRRATRACLKRQYRRLNKYGRVISIFGKGKELPSSGGQFVLGLPTVCAYRHAQLAAASHVLVIMHLGQPPRTLRVTPT